MSESSCERLSKITMSTCDRLTSASGRDLGVRPTGSKPAGFENSLCLRASSQTKLSRGLVRPAQEREELTALAADTSQAVSRNVHETGGEESSRCLMRGQSVVPCVGRGRAREPHTGVPEEEDATRDGARIVPLGKGRQRRAAPEDRAQSSPSRKKKTDTSDHATATRTSHTVVSQSLHSVTQSLSHSVSEELAGSHTSRQEALVDPVRNCSRTTCAETDVWG